MARVAFTNEKEATGKELEAYLELKNQGKLTNMKEALLQDYATYDAFMGWYTSWNRLVEIIGQRAAIVYAHSVSSTNGCLLCSLFFVSDLAEIGIDPSDFEPTEKEALLKSLAEQIVKNPTKVSDETFTELKKHYTDKEIVVIVGFACQMMATNNFNSVLQIDVDQRLLPIQDKFEPATWRDAIK